MTEDQSTPDDAQRPDGEPRFSFTDKRKVNPEDGSVRPSGGTPAPEGQGSSEPVDPIDAEAAKLYEQAEQGEAGSAPADAGRVAELEGKVTELSEQLKREQAEYVNSRRRIEAAAEVSKEAAVGRVLSALIPVLDDVELGRQHGDIAEGTPFHSISQKLEEILGSHGLQRFGAVGEEFDPNLHEALMHEDAEDVDTATISLVIQPGYTMNDRVLRPARVGTRGPA
ncbi:MULTISPECIES: nucleotide exchange factor GrpE [Brachybacterium]|uniref:Protein GrpE n=1 Tax=Brachybacterium alimentarium TaxID=47845 RepID=A0A2A3YK08_9MICO|nr:MULTISPECIES: nucleotide exchange factor GrpE [Brachybacterium]PCC31483.1 nucleotide exchange factor GrpE [Brachybacterium alimentarium]PCC39569.1 nucleotide exchange factor GrpE [Brachybacterium alimentarium]RCS65047.1 nucleotide exchange factor GrpE [Brachybacterium sp. JB7]RCS68787.1 nucleotide exchange factor GrpE [Brachybacterium alimentarium]RCS75765.1 nucleotide exchange factor GrpE [Brachybacterium alimentarium]